jgi:hypothetical protein
MPDRRKPLVYREYKLSSPAYGGDRRGRVTVDVGELEGS